MYNCENRRTTVENTITLELSDTIMLFKRLITTQVRWPNGQDRSMEIRKLRVLSLTISFLVCRCFYLEYVQAHRSSQPFKNTMQ